MYTVSPQGLRNSAEYGSEILARMYGDLVKAKKCTRIADQIYVLGNSLTELLENFKEVMERARKANLTFKPSKIIICPTSTVILGWKKQGCKWSPTEHVLSPLSLAEPPSTVKKMRGWLGAFRQIAKTIPNHAVVLQKFERMVGGKNSRDKIAWSPDLIREFDQAKASIATSVPIAIPRNTDKLKIFPDWSQDSDAVGGRLIIERCVDGKKVDLHGGEFSCRLKGAQARWTACEKECLGIKLLVQHYQPYIRENNSVTTVYTDNIVSVHAWNAIKLGKISTSSRVASFISTMCENKIDIVHYPGEMTKVADYNSRHPTSCTADRCQTCKFVGQELSAQEHYVRYTHSESNILLAERPTWLELQKQDSTVAKLYQLIKTGLSPEKKSRNRTLKLLHNMYRRGIVFIAADGLIQVRNVDVAHNTEYKAILVPEVYVAGVIQSLHLKLNHPSPYQLHKHMSRSFFAIGMTKVINNITSSCDTCTRLKILPKQVHINTTTKNNTFGTRFSADVLIEKGQHILLCREKLSQFTTTYMLQDETKESIEEGLISSLIDMVPEDGAVIQVDPGPSLVSLSNDANSVLLNFNIKIDVGRVHNKQKNPIAENAIKEFRKEWLRLKPDGAQLSDMERAQITASMNKRIRLNGLAPKEVMLKRNLKNHEPVQVDDNLEGQAQYDRKVQNNAKQLIKDKLSKQIPQKPTLQIGDLIYIIADLSKSRGREQFIVTKCFVKSDVHWIVARKFQKGLRNKEYLLKADEVILAPVTDNLESVFEEDEVDFQGFQDNIILDKRDRLKNLITTLEKDTQEKRNRGRPVLPVYPDYLNALPSDVCVTEEDEVFYGFDDRDVTTSSSKRDKLQQVLKQLENPSDNGFHGFSDQEIEDAIERKTKTNRLLQETRRLVVKLRSLQPTYVKNKTLHAWNYDQWLHIMENDMFEEKSKIQQVPVDDLPSLSESIQDSSDHLSYDDEEFYSVNDITIEDVATDMLDSNVSDLEVFNTHYENIPRESTSTPNRENFKSVTDPMLLDTITVMSSSESSLESDGEEDVLIAANVKELSEAMYLPVPVGPTRVEELLNKVHQSCPELSTPEVGRVYDMSPILDGIQQFESVMQVRQHAQQ